ncbi:hypothetical protein EQG63_08310 [Flavobacterium amnicola]|uniref:Uncharacterized protein n=1 Tax=Flavobacterium amnicola TaxID=2506422 RepID=A0A4Q1K175_9FLAO|nr:hypothetical protein [Flavobacterium amnicola]RXR18263.1 hypothetical protein EQG63_08310 [Flavobacterium amnicola]
MNKSEQELEKQESEIRRNLAYVFIPIALFIAIIFTYQNNSLDYKREKYLESKETEFNGKITDKKEDGDYPRASRFMILNDYNEVQIPNSIYYQINVGDSVYKERGKDTAYYYLKNGKVLVQDCNEYLRKEYLKLKSKEKEKYNASQ